MTPEQKIDKLIVIVTGLTFIIRDIAPQYSNTLLKIFELLEEVKK